MPATQQIPLKEDKIYTRRTQGFYQKLRRYTGIPLLLGYFLTPWISLQGRPAVLFDIGAQKFHILSVTLWPQDGPILAWLLIIAAFALFTVTVLFGRIWCGFTCPQTVWTLIFMWAEDKCEGDRNQRIRLDQQPWNTEKVLRKGIKHGLWLSIAFATGFTFVAYFYGGHDLAGDIIKDQVSLEASFWVFLFTLMTYMNAGWLREKVCLHMCPYARFQSAMYDDDTLLVTYDNARGEQGDCVECSWCVQVCPVDIDIRDGLQYSCIDCGLCADACDNVMDKIGLDRGLIRFSSQRAITTGKSNILRPRFVGYVLSLLAITTLFIYSVSTRSPVSVDVVRDRGNQLYYANNHLIENVYTVKINNKGQTAQAYELSIKGPQAYKLTGQTQVKLPAGEIAALPVRVSIHEENLPTNRERFEFVVQAITTPNIAARQEASFIGPDS